MTAPDAESPLAWTEDGLPRSRIYGDVYFSAADGLAETRAVFLEGCGLPEAWRGRPRFVVGELGFGTGLNIAALIHLWRRERPPGACLHVFSVEAHPIAADEAARALSAWPELAEAAQALIARWPGRARGFHRLEAPKLGVIIDLAVMEAAEALAAWTGRADAWFLDGFAPALNPQIWRQEVLDLVAARSAPGARAATFTVAGAVRRSLAGAGFAVEKKPGFGRKRERLEARLPGAPATPGPPPRVAVVGAGIAGAAAIRAVRALGGQVLAFEAEHPGAGASGNPAALVTPRLDAGMGPPAALFAQAFARAVDLYSEVPDAVIARGVLQLAMAERDPGRFARIASGGLFEPGAATLIAAAETARRLGEAAAPAMDLREALVVDPAPILAAWADGARSARVAALVAKDGGWRLSGPDGSQLGEAEAVILAAGLDTARLAGGAPLRPVRGQASWTSHPVPLPVAAAWGGYVAPLRSGGVLFGATHDRDDAATDLREADHGRNLVTLAQGLPGLAERVKTSPLEGRAGVRAATPDRLPLAGAAAGGVAGLYVLGGLGSRGFCTAPLLAEHAAALALGAPSPLPAVMQALVEPGRFLARAAARTRS